MHTPETDPRRPDRRPLVGLAPLCLLAAALLNPAYAGVPEPDAIVYGTVALNGAPLTAADTGLVVEARRTITGSAVASYRLGADSAAGDFYVLRLPIESEIPLLDPNASLVGDSLFIVLTDETAVLAQASCTLNARADVQRLDLGVTILDSDGDTLPDLWETTHFLNLASGPSTLCLNGQTALQNYVAGTNPQDPNSVLAVSISSSGDQVLVTFPGLRAEGAGYNGKTRRYTLQSCAELQGGWNDVPGFVAVIGNNLPVVHETASTAAPAFYRVIVWLEP